MRINLYSEELTEDVQLIEKADDVGEDGSLVTFYGARLYLESSSKMHQSPTDDDRSAVTFWFRGNEIDRVYQILRVLSSTVLTPLAAETI